MLKLSKQNKKIFNSVLLGLYFLFLATAIFHSHGIDYNTQLDYSDYNTPNKIADPFLDGKANCTLAQFFQSQILRYDCSNNLKFVLPLTEHTSPSYVSLKIEALFLRSLRLRAPPQLLA